MSEKTKEVTYATLYQLSQSTQQFRQQFPGPALAFESLLGGFITRNRVAFDEMSNGLEKLHKDNIKFDGAGKPIIKTVHPPKVFDGKTHQPIPQRPKQEYDFISDKHKEAFQTGWKELMEKKCLLVI